MTCRAKASVGQRVDQAVVQHETRAVPALLAGLEHEQHFARQGIGAGAKQFGSACQHRDMRIMAAGMHDAGRGRGEGQAGFLGHRQRVHIAAQQHPAAGCVPLQDPDQPGRRRAFAPGQRQVGERGADLVAGCAG